MRPVCVMCQREMRCSKTGRYVLLESPPGEPYLLIQGDEFKCPDCGATVVCQFAREPTAQAHERIRMNTFLRHERADDNVVVVHG